MRRSNGLMVALAASILVLAITLFAQADAYPGQVSKYINDIETDVGQGARLLRQILAMQSKVKQDREALASLIMEMEQVMPAFADPGDEIRMTRKRSF